MAQLVSMDEAARRLGGIHSMTVRQWVRAGRLPSVRLGRRIMIRLEDLDAFIDALPEARRRAHTPAAGAGA